MQIEVKLPDASISRISHEQVQHYCETGKFHRDWPARLQGGSDWSTVANCLELSLSEIDPQLHGTPPTAPSEPQTLRQKVPSPTKKEDGHVPLQATIRHGSAALPTPGEEVIIAAIGQRYLTSVLKGQGLESTSVVLSTSQISGGGQSFDLRGNKQSCRFLADVSNLSSIGFAKSSNLWWCILGLLGCGVGACMLLAGGVKLVVGLGIGCAGIFFWIRFFLSSKAILVLNISGHIEAISVSGVPKDELETFLSDSMKWLAQRSRHLSGASSVDITK